ncbi:MAG: hypothetical protein ACE5DM_02760 [Candidatus Nanoarchaeia archaeon]
MPEHVHMMVTLPHNVTDSKALMLLKFLHISSSRIIRKAGYDFQKALVECRRMRDNCRVQRVRDCTALHSELSKTSRLSHNIRYPDLQVGE